MATRDPCYFTFYSFKGGVGRSMALLNVAFSLVALGRNVLMVDMDLEAPGISGFLLRDGALDRSPKLGVLDLLAWALRFTTSHQNREYKKEDLPSLTDFTTGVDTKKLPSPRLGKLGQLHLIGAFLDSSKNTEESYFQKLDALGLPGLGAEELVAVSSAVRAALKNGRVKADVPAYYGANAREVVYDYILIDSRTGGTEIGGLCVGPLADRVVVFTGLNDQNVQGTKAFAKSVGISNFIDFGNMKSPDSNGSGLLFNPLPPDFGARKAAILVVSPLPAGELVSKDKRLEEIESELGKIAARLSYHSQMAILETNFVRDFPNEPLALEYRILRDRLMQSVRDDEGALIEQVRSYLRFRGVSEQGLAFSPSPSQLRPRERRTLSRIQRNLARQRKGPNISLSRTGEPLDFEKAVASTIRLGPINPILASSFLQQLAFLGQLDAPSNLVPLDRIYRIMAGWPDPSIRFNMLHEWGLALSERSRCAYSDDEADFFFKEAVQKFKDAALAQLPNDNSQRIAYSLADALLWHAQSKPGLLSRQLFEDAVEKIDEALKINPNDFDGILKRATAFRDRASRTDGPDAPAFFQKAYADYQGALFECKDKQSDERMAFESEVYMNWAITLGFHARAVGEPEAADLFQQAYAHFEKSNPLYDTGRTFWANLLADEARLILGDQSIGKFCEAYAKYSGEGWRESQPVEAMAGMARILAARPDISPQDDLASLLNRLDSELKPEEDADNALALQHTACAYALMADEEHCRKWLYRGRDVRNLEPRRLRYDPDFKTVREHRWFQDLMIQFSMIPSLESQS